MFGLCLCWLSLFSVSVWAAYAPDLAPPDLHKAYRLVVKQQRSTGLFGSNMAETASALSALLLLEMGVPRLASLCPAVKEYMLLSPVSAMDVGRLLGTGSGVISLCHGLELPPPITDALVQGMQNADFEVRSLFVSRKVRVGLN